LRAARRKKPSIKIQHCTNTNICGRGSIKDNFSRSSVTSVRRVVYIIKSEATPLANAIQLRPPFIVVSSKMQFNVFDRMSKRSATPVAYCNITVNTYGRNL